MKLNKKVLASLIAAGILTTGTALANPFDDVPQGHWSYDAVQTLADQGIIDGFGDGTYRGDKLMTRYEMAQIVGRAVSKAKEDNAVLEKLVVEYGEELQSLGVKVASLEKSTAGVRDLKISHWFQTENTYGKTFGGNAHEYELEYRLTAEKQVSNKLSMLTQMETMTYWDQTHWKGSRENDSVYMRLAYLTYKPDAKTTVIAGKNAYWLAGGLLGDDYISGVYMSTKLGEKTTIQALHGRYSEGNTNQINYAGADTKFGIVDFGVHFLMGQTGLTKTGPAPRIWSVTAASDIGAGVNLSVGYAKNKSEDNSNQLGKIQLYKKLGKVDTFLQYWKQSANFNPPIENGNHMAWWGDQYGGKGVDGYRLILGYPVSANCYAEAWYGDYKDMSNAGLDRSKKYGWALTFSY